MTAKLPPVIRPICGEYRGWNKHQRMGEDACPPCTVANAEYISGYRARTGRTRAKLYTPAEIEALRAEAVQLALRGRSRAHLRRRASRARP